MSKKRKVIIFIVGIIVILVAIWLLMFRIDYSRVNSLKDPIFSITITTGDNHVTYQCIGYRVEVEKTDIVVEDVCYNGVIIQTEMYMFGKCIAGAVADVAGKSEIESGITKIDENGNISNEKLIDEFIENCENGIESTLEIQTSKYNDSKEIEYDEAKLEFIPGTGDTKNYDDEIMTITLPQNDEDYKVLYGYYKLTINDEIIGEFDAQRWKIKRKTENGIVDVYFHTDFFDLAELTMICSYNLNTSNYEQKFELNYNQRKDMGVKEIASVGEYDNEDYGVYTFGGDVDITIEGDEVYHFKDALDSNVITVNDILDQVQIDLLYGICEEAYYSDGGSTEYLYKDYTILKCNTLDGNKDMVIGFSGNILSSLNETEYKGKSNIGESGGELENISMTIMAGTLTNTSARIVITTDVDDYGIGAWYRIDKKENGEWKELNYISDENYAWEDIAYMLNSEKPFEETVNWEKLYGALKGGTYRLVKEVGGCLIWVEFSIE